MTLHHRPSRGAAAVGTLEAFDGIEALLVRYLRLACAGPDGLAAIHCELSQRAGPGRARWALSAFEEIMSVFGRFGRRSFVSHDLECPCVGADEAIFAHFVAAASAGEREDAILMAMLLVRADAAPAAAAAAERLGLALRRAAPEAAARTNPAVSQIYH